ncbi:MAG TPA: fructosamine kinase family protein [Puia sp.]|nr:fructosamine kinase family protein [Puia sp.]
MASGVNEVCIQNLLSQKLNISVDSIYFAPVNGGCINETYKIIINQSQHFFCKINSAKKFPSFLIKEKNGLELLAKQNIIKTPSVIACEETESEQILILEWIEQGLKTKRFWEIFGEQLAKLHYVSNNYFGLEEDNYMGALHQSNSLSKKWVDFFILQRLEQQIKLAVDNNLLEQKHVHQFQNLYKFLPEIFLDENPSLLHGDLWSGNFLCDENSFPVLIDPAIYFGNRHIDLAMTTLFGGFDKTFYDSYHHHFTLPTNHRQIWDVCNLYPLLIHLNLFGRSYLHDILSMIQRY